MVIDYLNKKQAISYGVEDTDVNGDIFFRGDHEYENITFRNFPNLHLEEATFKNCTFEDCQEVSVYDKAMVDCKFKNVSCIDGHYTDFKDCSFVQCCSQGPLLVIDCDGSVDGCTFETITALGEDGYVVYAVYGNKNNVKPITNCHFTDCQVENKRENLIYCAHFKRFPSYRTTEIDNIDYESCVFEGET